MSAHKQCRRSIKQGLVLVLLAGGVAHAQDSASGAEEVRISCQQAVTALESGGSPSEEAHGIRTMQECGDLGIEKLVSYWQRPSLDAGLVRRLAAVSARVNDRRTYQAARAVVLNPSRSESFRLAALEVMVAGFDPSMAVTFPKPSKPMESSYVATGFVNHRSKKKGPNTVGAEARTDLISVLNKLAKSDPNERIRHVAAELGTVLDRRRAR